MLGHGQSDMPPPDRQQAKCCCCLVFGRRPSRSWQVRWSMGGAHDAMTRRAPGTRRRGADDEEGEVSAVSWLERRRRAAPCGRVLQDAHHIQTSLSENCTQAPVSVMPAGLVDDLTAAAFVDYVVWLKSLH